MADSTVSALTAASALTGAELLYGVQSAADRKITATQIKTFATMTPNYVSGRWYIPLGVTLVGSPTAAGANSMRLRRIYVPQSITIDTLGLRVVTIQASQNVQAAIYADDAALVAPTGNALVSTASMSTTTATVVNSAASLTFGPGFFWTATNCDHATPAFTGDSATGPQQSQWVGTTSQSNAMAAGQGLGGKSFAQTFGTWPDMTGQTLVDVTTGVAVPIVMFKIA